MIAGRQRHRPKAVELTAADWRKSSRSQTTNCVEVALSGGVVVAVRDSKDRGGPVLAFSRAQWLAFLAGAKDGEFDLN